VLEKSDCAVVPVNPPNKAATAAAEAGEGRAQMKENIGQPRMLPTQSGNRMSQGLDGVRTAARERKQERFTSLLHHVTIALLRDSLPPDTIDSWRSATLESVEASQPGSPRNVPGAAFKASLYTEGRWAAAPVGRRAIGRQNRPAGRGDDPQSDL
jgi:hypothetical protein